MEENTPPVPEKDHIPAQGDTTPAQENIPPTQENILQTSENVPPVPGNDIPKPQNKKRSIRIATIFIILSVVVAVILMCLPLLIEKAAKDALIKIPRHATREMVQDSISKYLDDDYAEKVMRVAKLRGSDFGERHGAYLIEQGMSPLQAEHRLSHGAQQPLTVTINHFRTKENLAKKVAAKLDFTSDQLLKTLNDEKLLSEYGLTKEQALSLFLEDSYEFYWTASPEAFISKIGDNYKKIWNEERTAKAKELGLFPAEVMTIASIVDEETNKLDEKDEIGRLYINRYKKGIKLQADPTVKYAIGNFALRRILSGHLKTRSPYNTYLNTGLPPGPIRTTSVATIDQILNSQPSDHIYMCAKEDFSGRHNFASTYQEHLANARRYQAALNKRGIR